MCSEQVASAGGEISSTEDNIVAISGGAVPQEEAEAEAEVSRMVEPQEEAEAEAAQ